VAAKGVAATFVAARALPENSRFPTSSDEARAKSGACAEPTRSAIPFLREGFPLTTFRLFIVLLTFTPFLFALYSNVR